MKNKSIIVLVLNYIIENDFPNRVDILKIREYVRGKEKQDSITEKDIGNAIGAFYDVYNNSSLKIEGFKTALDYIQLKEAREATQKALEASSKALNVAVWSFGVSIFVLIASIFFSSLTVYLDHPEFINSFFQK